MGIENGVSQQPMCGRTGLSITGIGLEWPDHLMNADELQEYIEKFYSKDEKWVQQLIKWNRNSLIARRPVLDLFNDDTWSQQSPPNIEDGDKVFRTHGVRLSYLACQKALKESCISVDQVTHIVAVTATNAGCPGLDHLVAEQLGMVPSAERILLGGAGCAGGMAATRVAADIALSCSFRRKPARVLVIACELSSTQIRAELEVASASQESRMGPVLFSDGAAALVVCNDLALRPESPRVYLLDDWTSSIAPSSTNDVTVNVHSLGFLVELSKRVPDLAAGSVSQPFELLSTANGTSKSPKDYDWALHPGGYSIIRGVQATLGLSDDSLRASFDTYKNKGNTASVSVIAVMERLRHMGPGKENVVACAFGPVLQGRLMVAAEEEDVVELVSGISYLDSPYDFSNFKAYKLDQDISFRCHDVVLALYKST